MLILRLAGLVDKKPAIPILGSLVIRSILGSARYRASVNEMLIRNWSLAGRLSRD